MESNSLISLCGRVRCLIRCPKVEDNVPFENGEAIMIKIIQFALGDPQKASLLATVEGTRTFIVFDYNNPDHLNNCKVLGFQVKKSTGRIKSFHISSKVEKYVHSMVTTWEARNKQHGLSFPYLEKVCRAPTPSINLLGTY